MKRQSRAFSSRTHKHTDYSKKVGALQEDDLIPLVEAADNPLILILDQVQDPHNLGACLRTADGAGVTAVIAPKDQSVRINDTVRRIACGGAESVPFFLVTNLARTMGQLKEAGVWLTGTADGASQSLYEVDFKGATGIVMGAEGKGMRRLTQENCDFVVTFPMLGKVECLNVSAAAAVCLYEVVRQRLGT
ncbi:MAG: 23S rRNA (guanosine(2251)-2'-O)-methyltransferase RlmB [Verrucomicrobiales bacterium]